MFPLDQLIDFTQIKQICADTPSRIFGFILYTRAHSFIVKTLKDDDFWNELDEISGANWPIFAVKPLAESVYTYPNTRPGTIQMMVPIRHEPRENQKYLDMFSLKSTDLPCFVAFIWNDDDSIDQITCKLSNRNLNEAFDSIREIVEIISDTENQIRPEYKRSENVFRNVKSDLSNILTRKKIAKTSRRFFSILGFMSNFR